MGFVLAFYVILFALIVVVFIRGQWPERVALCLFITAAALTRLGIMFLRPRAGVGLAPPVFALPLLLGVIDVALIAGLLALAVRSGRRWLIWVAGFQVISTIAHLGRMIDPTFNLIAYAMMESFSAYPSLILLAVAVWRHPQQRAGAPSSHS